jgi:hypothetical protein
MEPERPTRDETGGDASETTGGAASETGGAASETTGGDASETGEHPESASAGKRSGPAPAALSGREGRIPGSGWGALLRWVSGWALLSWAGRLLLLALGWRREASVELSDGYLSIRRTTVFRGRVIRESEEKRSLRTLLAASRQVRYPSLHLAVGALSLAVGILVGGLFAWDALRFGDRTLLLIGSLVLAGAGLDLVLDILVPGRARRVALEIRVEQGRGLRLVGVPLGEADRLLNALARSLRRTGSGRGGV